MEELAGSRFRYLPEGNPTPHIMVHKKSSGYSFIIPKFDKDISASCAGKNECYLEINRGYKCLKHRV